MINYKKRVHEHTQSYGGSISEKLKMGSQHKQVIAVFGLSLDDMGRVAFREGMDESMLRLLDDHHSRGLVKIPQYLTGEDFRIAFNGKVIQLTPKTDVIIMSPHSPQTMLCGGSESPRFYISSDHILTDDSSMQWKRGAWYESSHSVLSDIEPIVEKDTTYPLSISDPHIVKMSRKTVAVVGSTIISKDIHRQIIESDSSNFRIDSGIKTFAIAYNILKHIREICHHRHMNQDLPPHIFSMDIWIPRIMLCHLSPKQAGRVKESNEKVVRLLKTMRESHFISFTHTDTMDYVGREQGLRISIRGTSI